MLNHHVNHKWVHKVQHKYHILHFIEFHSNRIVLCCIVLYCIVLYCIVLYCIVCIVLYCIVLYCRHGLQPDESPAMLYSRMHDAKQRQKRTKKICFAVAMLFLLLAVLAGIALLVYFFAYEDDDGELTGE